MRGKQRPSSPKPREIEDILQLASIKAKCTTETECRFKGNFSLKLPLAESCLWSAKKSVGSKVAFAVSRTNAEFPVGWSNWEFWSGNQCRGFLFGVGTQCWGLGVLPSVDVACEEWLSLHAEMLVSPNATNLRWRDSRNSQRGPCASDTQLDSLKAWCARRWTKPNNANRGHARTHEFPWREWQVDTNQILRTGYSSE